MNSRFAFIVGSPRSGTTILEEILEQHTHITTWYEPLFVMDRFFKHVPHDARTASDVTPRIRRYIQYQYRYFATRHPNQIIIDKNPANSMKLPFLEAIFEQPSYIHIIRDGRDATLSISREWQKRKDELTASTSYLKALKTLYRFVQRQPLLKHKVEALIFEFGSPVNLLDGRKGSTYRGRRWKEYVGWGPQFEGWQEVIDKVTRLEFNAMQWRACVEAVLEYQPRIPTQRFLEIRYEELLQHPEDTLNSIFEFLNVDYPPGFTQQIPTLMRENFSKWKTHFAMEEKAQIGPILHPLLQQLGYAKDERWWRSPTT